MAKACDGMSPEEYIPFLLIGLFQMEWTKMIYRLGLKTLEINYFSVLKSLRKLMKIDETEIWA